MSAPTNAELSTKINELTDLIRNLATARVRTPSPAPAQPQVQPSSGVQVTPLSANVIAAQLPPPPEEFYALHSDVSRQAAFYLWHGLAGSTRTTYGVGQRSFVKFCDANAIRNADGSLLPASVPAILEWATSLAGKVQPKTIKAYITHVKSAHIEHDLPFPASNSTRLQRLIRGIKRYHGEKDRKPKLPITYDILTKILANLSQGPSYHAVYAACCLAYCGFLRCGEFTVNKGTKFDPAINLSGASIEFIKGADGTNDGVRLTLAASKTDPFRKGVTIAIAGAPGLVSDPVAALERLLAARGDRNVFDPLLEEEPGKVLTRDTFIREVRAALERAGIPPTGYAGHSFRRGAATMAAALGIPGYEIQILGRWLSDTWKLYVEVDPRRVRDLSRSLHGDRPHGVPFDPLGSA